MTWEEFVEAKIAELLGDPVFESDFGHLGDDELYSLVADDLGLVEKFEGQEEA